MKQSDARRDGRYLLLLGAAFFLLIGFAVEHQSGNSMEDFKSVYYGTRCLMQHQDPYRPAEVFDVYRRETRGDSGDSSAQGQLPIITTGVYPPATFLLVAPFALLGWNPAHIVWMLLIAACYILAAYLAWDLAADSEALLSGLLAGLLLADSFGALLSGNPAGVVVSFCVVAVWCFLRNRFPFAGALGLALCLIIKPHDAWLIWLWLLLGGALYRRRAWQTLLCAGALSIPAVFWTAYIAPHWIREYGVNLALVSGAEGINNPGPSSLSTHTAGMIVDLQTFFSVFKDDPHFYNPASYLVFAIVLALWILASVRTPASRSRMLLSLAALSMFTLLPVYHRTYDARLILLTIPAFAAAWSQKRKKWLTLAVTAAGIILSGDLVLATLVWATDKMHLSAGNLQEKVRMILLSRPLPLLFLVIGGFYLVLFMGDLPDREFDTARAEVD